MESYAQITLIFWIIFCFIAVIRRLVQPADEPEIKPSNVRYIALTGALGLVLCISGVLKEPESSQWGFGQWYIAVPLCLWFIAWPIISLKEIFSIPRQLLPLPIYHIFLAALLAFCKLLFINKWETHLPDWAYFGDLLFGGSLVLGSIGSYFRAKQLIVAQTTVRNQEKQTEALITHLHSLGPPSDESDRDAFSKYNQSKDEALRDLGEAGRALWLRIQEDKLTPVERGKWNRLFENDKNTK